MAAGSLSKETEAGQIRESAWRSFGGPLGDRVSESDINRLFAQLNKAERLYPSNDIDLIALAVTKSSRARLELLLRKGTSSHAISDAAAAAARKAFYSGEEIKSGRAERAARASRLARACDLAIDSVKGQLATTEDNKLLLEKVARYQADYWMGRILGSDNGSHYPHVRVPRVRGWD